MVGCRTYNVIIGWLRQSVISGIESSWIITIVVILMYWSVFRYSLVNQWWMYSNQNVRVCWLESSLFLLNRLNWVLWHELVLCRLFNHIVYGSIKIDMTNQSRIRLRVFRLDYNSRCWCCYNIILYIQS